ncbi:MAG TPA: TonB-dependent receptor [Thermoanaerobaculia bacterium]|nr:TonB-dependent receptor [Thermoanaerobaculia bacterium]
MRPRFTVLTLLLVLFVCFSAFAQTTTTLTGVVTTDGAPLPGVTVTISSPSMQGTRTSITSDAGGYSFPALPPGTYKVRFELDGMATIERSAQLALSQPAKIDAEMKMSAVAEAITVTAVAPSVLESPQVAATITAEQIEQLPVPRTFEGAALLAPGVNGNTLSASQFQISGSPGYDNLVMVNGVSVTESVRSQFLNLFIEDAVQETTVLTGAISAEYGRFTGGVVNTITKSGGNEFTGSFRDSLSNPSWTNTTPFGESLPDVTNNVYEGTLGGYAIRDRLWFFVAGRSAESSEARSTRAVSSSNPLRVRPAIDFTYGLEETRYEVKLTGQLTPKHNLVGSYIDVDRKDLNNRFTTAIYDLESLENRTRPDTLSTVHYNGVLTNNLLVEGQWSHRTMEFVGSGSKFTDLQKGTLLLDQSNGNSRFNSPTFCGVCDTESRNNNSLLLKANYFLSTKGTGNHNIVGGVEDFTEMRYANNHQSGSDYRLLTTTAWFNSNGNIYPVFSPNGVAGFSSPTIIRWTPIFENANESELNVQSAFLNDKWDLNQHWTFNLGVRYDKNDAIDGSGTKSSDDQAISPRLTAIFDPKGDGRHRFSVAYNNYVSRIVEGIASSNSAAGSPATIDFAYNGPVINGPNDPFAVPMNLAIQQVFDWFFAQCNAQGQCGPNNNALLRQGGARSIPGYAAVFNGTLKSPSVDEIALGYATQFGSNAWAKLDFIKRDWKDFYAQEAVQGGPKATTPLNIPVDLLTITNTDDIKREYHAVQLQAGWRPRRWNFGANYTYSKLEGNDEGETAGSGPVANQPLATYYPEFLGYANRLPEGPLAGDQRHRARVWAGYDVPLPPVIGNLNISLLQQYNSGIAYNASFTADIDSYVGAPTAASLGYNSAPGTATYYVCRGCLRAEAETRTDLAFNYARPIWRAEVFVQADVLNIFDEDAMSNPAGITTGLNRTSTLFNPFTTTPDEGVHYTKASGYGKANSATAYQLARTYQFSVGLRF